MKTPLLCLSFCLLAGSLSGEIPKSIPHQGRIAVGGVNFDGAGQFKFLLFADPDANHASGNESALWSNAATSPAGLGEPASAVSIPVAKGLYGTWLGDATIANMAALPASIEPPAGSRLYLRIWFSNGVSGFQALSPDQSIAAVPFALHAAGVAEGGVTAESLADGAITSTKLADGAVTQAKLATGAVTSATLADDAVTADKIATGAVTGIGIPGSTGSIQPDGILVRDSDGTNMFEPQSVAVQGNFAYVVDGSVAVLQIFEISNPDAIVPRDFDATGLSSPRSVAVNGNFAYVVDQANNRLQIFDVSNPDSIVPRDFDLTGLAAPQSVAVTGNFAYVVNAGNSRLQIFDVTDPNNIVPRDFEQSGLSLPRFVAAQGNFVYVVDSFTDRLQIFDVSNPDDIVPRDFDGTGLDFPRSVAVQGSFAYVVDNNNKTLRVFDISDPDAIVPRGLISVPIGAPQSIAVNGTLAAVVTVGFPSIHMFDISNPDDILARGVYQSGLSSPVTVALRQNLAYVGEQGTDRLQIFQVGVPVVKGALQVSDSLSASNLSVTGNVTSNSITSNTLNTGSLSASSNIVASGSISSLAVATGDVSANTMSANSASIFSMTAGSFNLSSPKTYTLSIPGIALVPQNPSENLFRSTLGFIQQAAGTDLAFGGVAPINLPQGAVITGIDTMYYDNAAAADFTNLTIRVRRVSTTSNPVVEQNILATDILSPVAGNSTAMIVSTNNTPDVSRATVDNGLYTYFLSLTHAVSAVDGNLRFYGFRIRYTLNSLTP